MRREQGYADIFVPCRERLLNNVPSSKPLLGSGRALVVGDEPEEQARLGH
jgi:hypothetical protein